MVFVPSIAVTLAAALSLTPVLVFGHPGEQYGKREAMEEMGNAHVVSMMNRRALESCQNSPAVKARKERASELFRPISYSHLIKFLYDSTR